MRPAAMQAVFFLRNASVAPQNVNNFDRRYRSLAPDGLADLLALEVQGGKEALRPAFQTARSQPNAATGLALDCGFVAFWIVIALLPYHLLPSKYA